MTLVTFNRNLPKVGESIEEPTQELTQNQVYAPADFGW
jgi:hypothetical protein